MTDILRIRTLAVAQSRRLRRLSRAPRSSRCGCASFHRRGAAACEFMVTLPLIVLLCLMSVDLGRVLHAYASLTNAARVGAQTGATSGHTSYSYDDWEEDVANASMVELEGSLGAASEDVTIEVSTADEGAESQVVVDSEYSFRTIIDWPGLDPVLPVRARCCMRRYR
jgi:Flp pilus assembly protein TadG